MSGGARIPNAGPFRSSRRKATLTSFAAIVRTRSSRYSSSMISDAGGNPKLYSVATPVTTSLAALCTAGTLAKEEGTLVEPEGLPSSSEKLTYGLFGFGDQCDHGSISECGPSDEEMGSEESPE